MDARHNRRAIQFNFEDTAFLTAVKLLFRNNIPTMEREEAASLSARA